jgi:hypothetical protein
MEQIAGRRFGWCRGPNGFSRAAVRNPRLPVRLRLRAAQKPLQSYQRRQEDQKHHDPFIGIGVGIFEEANFRTTSIVMAIKPTKEYCLRCGTSQYRYPRKFKTTDKIEYDTYMPDRVGVKVRCLPDGDFHDALQVSSEGRFLELELTGESLPLGSLLEIEQGSMLYWGELQQVEGTTATVFVEHLLDSSGLQPIREIWGE